MSYRAYYSAHGLCVKNSQPRGLMELDISAVADRAEMEHLYADSARPDDFPFLSVWTSVCEEKLEPEQEERGGEGSRKGEGRGFICALGYWL